MSANQGRASYHHQPNIQTQRFTASPFTPDGGYTQAHPQNQQIYQTQNGPPGVQNQQPQQSNPSQSLSNAVQQNQARLTPMSQPTAPPTPPTQQNQQNQINQSQQGPQYAVQITQQGIPGGAGGAGNNRTPQYRPQSQVPRRNQQQINQQQFIYPQPLGSVPYSFVIPPGAHVRPYSYMFPPTVFNNYAAPTPNYGPMTAQPNGQQRQSTPQATAQTMPPPQVNEYSYPNIYDAPSVMQPAVPTQVPPPSQQKTVKKSGSKAIQIINPITGKSIFEDDSSASSSGGNGSLGPGAGLSSIATVDKAITASHNELNKDEAVESKDSSSSTTTAEPSTPVVSAMSDGPSVDITPKHQVNKTKKVKPPEPVSVPAPVVLAEPPKPTKAVEVEPEIVNVAPVSQDSENNNSVSLSPSPAPIVAPTEPVIEVEVVQVVPVAVAAPLPLDVNDTNNNNYQKVSQPEDDEKEVKITSTSTPQASREVEVTPQDSNNNSTDDKSIMTSPSIRHNAAQLAVPEKDEKPAAVQTEIPASRKISVVDGPIDYDDGQWSPANIAGKKYYTRDQLLKLKDQPISATPPAITKLPDNVAHTLMKNNKDLLTSTLNQTMPLPGPGGNMARGPFDLINSVAPKFMANQMSGRNPFPKRPSQQGNKQQVPGGGRGSQAGIIKLTLALQDDVKLNEAENAWKPSHLVKKQDMTEEDRVTSDLHNRFRSMLNKLTAENFELLVEQVKLYKIDTGERLDGVISLVFEKAISEPKFAPTYANLCKEVSNITTASSGQGEAQKKNTLKVKLITQCQREFERHKDESILFTEIEKKLREIENRPQQDKRDDEKARLEEQHYRVRQRANGTVKFIGELYKIDMLTSKIMLTCIDILMLEVTEEKIERVCKLLTTVGSKLEHQNGRKTLDKYFSLLSEMIHPNHKVIKSSRIKFEIQNLEDLRNNGWKSRRQDLTPRTMDQIQMEAEREQQMINYQTRQNAKEDRNRGGNQGGYNRRQQPSQDSDGWSVQQNNKSRTQPIQFNKISLPSLSSEGPKLGNPTNYQNFMVQNTNKFSGLPVDSEMDGPPRFGSGSKNSSMERSGDRGSHYYGNGTNQSDGRYSGRSSGSNQGSRNSSQIRSRDNSDGRGGPSRSLQAPTRLQQPPPGSSLSFSGAVKQPQKVSAAIPAEPISQEEIDKNYKVMLQIVDDFRDDKFDIEGAMTKLMPLKINKDVLVEIYNKYLDRKHRDRENLMMVICEMLKQKKVTAEVNRAALIETMEMAPDMACDVPLVYEYIAHFLGELLIATVITFQDVHKICNSDFQSKGNSEEMLQFIFELVGKRHGASKLQHIVAESDCSLEQFISDGNLNRWLEVNSFTNMVRRGTNGIQDVMTHIKQMLVEKQGLENINTYIASNDCTTDPNFIRSLTKVVMEHSCEEFGNSTTPSYKLQNNRLEDLAQLLHRYIDGKSLLELQCITALQSFAHAREYPSGLLNSTFEILYDNDVLSVEAFELWKDSKDQGEGKGVAICSTRQFFTKLEEDKDEDPEYDCEDGDT